MIVTAARSQVLDFAFGPTKRILAGNPYRLWWMVQCSSSVTLFIHTDGSVTQTKAMFTVPPTTFMQLSKADVGSIICGEWWANGSAAFSTFVWVTEVFYLPSG